MPPLPRPLPLPVSLRIDEIIHVSDIHIPFIKHIPQEFYSSVAFLDGSNPSSAQSTTSLGLRRIYHFRNVISGLIKSVWGTPSVKEGRAAVVVAGDLFDCKHVANAVTVKLLQEFIVGLCVGQVDDAETRVTDEDEKKKDDGIVSPPLPVYVISGNHDIHLDIVNDQASPEENDTKDRRHDLLGALLSPITEKYPVAYITRTGVYGTLGSGALLGVLHIKDAMQPGNCSGHTRSLENIPLHDVDMAGFSSSTDAKIFVYHGQVTGHRIFSSHGQFVDDRHSVGIPAPHIAETLGYDACMLGDIHTMQLHNMVYEGEEGEEDRHTNESVCGDVATCLGRFSWDPAKNIGSMDDPVARKKRIKEARSADVNNNSGSSIPWAYSGSLLQLNAGERLFPHGYLRWNLTNRYVIAYHVHSDVGIFFCTVPKIVQVSSTLDKTTLEVHNAITPLCDSGVPAPLCIEFDNRETRRFSLPDWLPRKAVVRIVGGGVVTSRMMEATRDALRNVGIEMLGASNSNRSAAAVGTAGALAAETSLFDTRNGDSNDGEIQYIDLSRFGLPESWMEYISQCFSFPGEEAAQFDAWKKWLNEPEKAVCDAPPEDIPDGVKQKITDRNNKILKKCTEWRDTSDTLSTKGGGEGRSCERGRGRFGLGVLRWSWLLCFADENCFDFSSMKGKVALLSAPNGSGKSSVLEILCLALHGQPMPSRGSKTNISDALCKGRPQPSTPGSCSVDVVLEGEGVFRLSRSFSWTPASRVVYSARVSRMVPPHNTLVTVKDGTTGVNTWVAHHLGNLTDFLLSSLLTQDGDSDFFAMKPAEQRALLDNALALDSARVMGEVLKEARLAHSSVIDSIDTVIETGDQSTQQSIKKQLSDNTRSVHLDDDISDTLSTKIERARTLVKSDMDNRNDEIEDMRKLHRSVLTCTETLKSHVERYVGDTIVIPSPPFRRPEDNGRKVLTSNILGENEDLSRSFAEMEDDVKRLIKTPPCTSKALLRQEVEEVEMEKSRWPSEWVLALDMEFDRHRERKSTEAEQEEIEKSEEKDSYVHKGGFSTTKVERMDELDILSSRRAREADEQEKAKRMCRSFAEYFHKIPHIPPPSSYSASGETENGKVVFHGLTREVHSLTSDCGEYFDTTVLMDMCRELHSLEESMIIAKERLSELRHEKETHAKLIEMDIPSENEMMTSLRSVERMFERAKEDLSRSKQKRSELDSSVRERDSKLEIIREEDDRKAVFHHVATHGKEGDDEIRDDHPACVAEDRCFEEWQMERRDAIDAIAADKTRDVTVSAFPLEEETYDLAYEYLRETTKHHDDALRDASEMAVLLVRSREMKSDVYPDRSGHGCEDEKEYDENCRFCMNRQELLRNSMDRKNEIIGRLKEFASRYLKDGDRGEEDGLTWYADICRASEEVRRVLREWEKKRFSTACGAREVITKYETLLRARNVREAISAGIRCTRLDAEADRCASEAKDSKRAYQARREEHEVLRSKKDHCEERRKQLEKDIEGVVSELERMNVERERVSASLHSTISEYSSILSEREENASERVKCLSTEIETLLHLQSTARGEEEQGGDARKRRAFREEVEKNWRPRLARCGKLSEESDAWYNETMIRLPELEEMSLMIESKMQDIETEISRMTCESSILQMCAETYLRWVTTKREWSTYRDVIQCRKSDLEELCGTMSGFTSWVYTHRALPALVREVNFLLASMNARVLLKGTCKSEDAASLCWTLNDAPIYKSSGMQRFVASLGMRIALSQLGACSHSCRQLVIDEGFVALDGFHIAHVPEFLHEGIIAAGRFESVLLVSHLEGVKEAADVIVPITRHPVSSSIVENGDMNRPSSPVFLSRLHHFPPLV